MKYIKRPIEVEAFQLTVERYYSSRDWPKWLVLAVVKQDGVGILVETLSGLVPVVINDWVLRGPGGEVYPCKPSAFNKTYRKLKD